MADADLGFPCGSQWLNECCVVAPLIMVIVVGLQRSFCELNVVPTGTSIIPSLGVRESSLNLTAVPQDTGRGGADIIQSKSWADAAAAFGPLQHCMKTAHLVMHCSGHMTPGFCSSTFLEQRKLPPGSGWHGHNQKPLSLVVLRPYVGRCWNGLTMLLRMG